MRVDDGGEHIGFDLVEVARVREMLIRWGSRLTVRVLTPAERAYVEGKRDPAPHLAGMVAAKEACFKALGLGPAQGVGWHDIAIGHSPMGAPLVTVSGGARQAMAALGGRHMAVSISHERSVAGAIAVLLRV